MNKNKILISSAVTIAVLVVVAFAGSTEWSMFRQGSQRGGAADSALRPPLSVRWSFQAEGEIYSSPAVTAGLVYIGSRDKHLHAVDAKTGLVKWSYETGDWVDASPLVHEGRVYVPSRDGAIYALNAVTGQLAWKADVGGTHCSSPVVYNDKVIFGAGYPSKFVVALNIADGSQAWKHETTQMVYSSPALFNSTLFIGANNGKYIALDPETGEEKWSVQTGGGIYFSTPAVSGGKVFAAPGDFDRNIYAWSADDGSIIWKYQVPGSGKIMVSSPSADADTVYISAGYPTIKLIALNQETGALKWETEIGEATQIGYLSSPAAGLEYVWAGTGDGKILAVDKSNGSIESEIELDSAIQSSPALTNDRLLVASSSGILYAMW